MKERNFAVLRKLEITDQTSTLIHNESNLLSLLPIRKPHWQSNYFMQSWSSFIQPNIYLGHPFASQFES